MFGKGIQSIRIKTAVPRMGWWGYVYARNVRSFCSLLPARPRRHFSCRGRPTDDGRERTSGALLVCPAMALRRGGGGCPKWDPPTCACQRDADGLPTYSHRALVWCVTAGLALALVIWSSCHRWPSQSVPTVALSLGTTAPSTLVPRVASGATAALLPRAPRAGRGTALRATAVEPSPAAPSRPPPGDESWKAIVKARSIAKAQGIKDLVDGCLAGETPSAAMPAKLLAMAQDTRTHEYVTDDAWHTVVKPQVIRLCAMLTAVMGNLTSAEVCVLVDGLAVLSMHDSWLKRHLNLGPKWAGGATVVGAVGLRLTEPHFAAPLDGPQAARLIWGLGRIGLRRPDAVAAVGARLTRPDVLPDLRPVDVSLALWGLAKMGDPSARVVQALVGHVLGRGLMGQFEAQSLVNTAWALSKFKAPHEPMMVAIAGRVQEAGLAAFSPAEVGTLAYAFASMRLRDNALMAAVAAHVTQPAVLARLTPQDLVNVAWAFGRLRMRDEALLAALAQRAQSPDCQRNFGSKHVSNLVWAYAALRYPDAGLLAAVAERLLQREFLDTFQPRGISNVVWGLATLGCRDHRVFRGIADHVTRDDGVARFNAQGLSNVAWAYATAGVRHEVLMAAISWRIRHDNMLMTFDPQGVANTAWAFAKLGIRDEPLMAAFAEYITHKEGFITRFKPGEVAPLVPTAGGGVGARLADLLRASMWGGRRGGWLGRGITRGTRAFLRFAGGRGPRAAPHSLQPRAGYQIDVNLRVLGGGLSLR